MNLFDVCFVGLCLLLVPGTRADVLVGNCIILSNGSAKLFPPSERHQDGRWAHNGTIICGTDFNYSRTLVANCNKDYLVLKSWQDGVTFSCHRSSDNTEMNLNFPSCRSPNPGSTPPPPAGSTRRPPAGSTRRPPAGSTPPRPGQERLSTGAITGIVIGVIVVIGLVIGLVIWVVIWVARRKGWCCFRTRGSSGPAANGTNSSSPENVPLQILGAPQGSVGNPGNQLLQQNKSESGDDEPINLLPSNIGRPPSGNGAASSIFPPQECQEVFSEASKVFE